MFAWFFLAALYLQDVLDYSALQVGLAFLPTSVVMAFCSLQVSDRLVMRFGIRPPLVVGLALAGVSLALFAFAPVDGSFVVHVLPSMILLGIGAGIAFNPVLLAAMGDVEPHESGLASGVVNTAFMMGGALGLAVLVAVSDSRRATLLAEGLDPVAALNGGLHVAFAVGAVAAFGAAADRRAAAAAEADGHDRGGCAGRSTDRTLRLTPRSPLASAGDRPADPQRPAGAAPRRGHGPGARSTCSSRAARSPRSRPGLERPAGVEEIDAEGRWVAPGLWDQHVHLTQWVEGRQRLDLAGATSVEEATRLVAAADRGATRAAGGRLGPPLGVHGPGRDDGRARRGLDATCRSC